MQKSLPKALMTVDLLDWPTEGVFGGAYNKLIRWSFEKQGLYQPPGAPLPPNVTTEGVPDKVDVYIDDGRHGEYQFQPTHWNNTSIWNRRMSDGSTVHEKPIIGSTNYIYVKIKNRGTEIANNVKVHGYHSRVELAYCYLMIFNLLQLQNCLLELLHLIILKRK